MPLPRYRSFVFDSGRWDGFELRPDDIVISSPPKSGTTLTQMLCALLVFGGPEFPASLDALSPWLDMCNRPRAVVHAAYGAQTHRRFIKTHTPLDGLPRRPGVTYLVVGRDPRDVAISYEHHAANMDFDHFAELRARALTAEELQQLPERRPLAADPKERFRQFVHDAEPGGPPSLASTLHHLATGWQRRREPGVALFHYADFRADLAGEIGRLARVLGIPCTPDRAAALAAEATLDRMRERATELAPSVSQSNWKDVRKFFRSGAAGEWRDRFDADELAAYDERVAELAPADLAAWAHQGRRASGIDPDVA